MNKQKILTFVERNKKSNNYLLKKTAFSAMIKLVRAVLLFGLCFLILQPLLNKISVSFMEEQDLYNSTVVNIPLHFTTANYTLTAKLLDYWNAMFTTAGISLISSVIQIIACTLVGYGFARYKFPLKNVWFGLVMLVILVPPTTIMSSLYLNFSYFDILGIFKLTTGKPLNLLGSVTPYLLLCIGCMGLKSGLYIYMIRQFFRGIPVDIEEAAYVDGCGKLYTFARIMLPDAKPIITSCFLFSFVWQWTDSFYSRMFFPDYPILSYKLTGLSGALDSYLSAGSASPVKASIAYSNSMVATGTLMAIIPLIIIYLVAQRGFVESLSQSGIKM